MKKLFAMLTAIVLISAIFAGCVNSGDSGSSDTDSSSSSRPASSLPEVDINYETLLEEWKNEYEGYWAEKDGAYAQFAFDGDGKAVLYFFDKDGNQTAEAKALTLMASDKSSSVLKTEYRGGEQKSFLIEKAGGAGEVPYEYLILRTLDRDGEIREEKNYVFAGKDTTGIAEAVKNAAKIK